MVRSPLGARFFGASAPGAPLGGFAGDASGMHGLNRLGSHSSNGSDPIGMYMNFDGHGAGPGPVGSGGSGGDLAGQAGGGGSNGSPAREMGSHQEVTSDTASMWMHPYMPGYVGHGGGYPGPNRGNPPGAFSSLGTTQSPFAPFPANDGYGVPGYGVVQQANPYFAEPVGAFAMQQQPGYPATQQPPAMHDQIHRVGAAPPRPPSGAAMPAGSPYQHTAGGASTMLPRAGDSRGSAGRLARDDAPSAGAQAGRAPAHYPRAGTGGGVPASYVSAEAAHAAQYAPYAPGSFYDGAPPVAGVIGAHAPGGMVRMERNSQGSLGGSGGSGGGGLSGGGGSVVAISGLVHRGPYGFGSHEFLVGSRGHAPAGGSDGEDAARGGPNGSSALLDPNDEIRATAGSMAPGTKAREEMLVRYHKKRKERHFKKKIRYASRKVRADNRVRIKGRFARADAPLVTIDKSSAKNHPDIKGDTREEAEEGAVPDKSDAEERETGDSDSESEAEDDEPTPVGKRTRRGVHAVSKGLQKGKATHMTGVSELATPDVPPGACA